MGKNIYKFLVKKAFAKTKDELFTDLKSEYKMIHNAAKYVLEKKFNIVKNI